MGKIEKGRRMMKLIEAFKFFGGKVKNQQLKKYFLDNYKDHIFKSIQPSSLDGSINGQLQFYSKSNGGNNFTNRYDLFYKKEKGEWLLRENYNEELEKYNKFYKAKDLDLFGEHEQTQRKEYNTNRIIRDNKIIKELKEMYGNRCQICNKKIEISKGLFYSEGHHIKPLGREHNGPDKQENVLILCPDHHAQFDYGVIAIDPITSQIKYKYQKEKHDKIIISHKIGEEYLKYHYDNIFNI